MWKCMDAPPALSPNTALNGNKQGKQLRQQIHRSTGLLAIAQLNSLMFSGSPPKSEQFALIHFKAKHWSLSPAFPGISNSGSLSDKNPAKTEIDSTWVLNYQTMYRRTHRVHQLDNLLKKRRHLSAADTPDWTAFLNSSLEWMSRRESKPSQVSVQLGWGRAWIPTNVNNFRLRLAVARTDHFGRPSKCLDGNGNWWIPLFRLVRMVVDSKTKCAITLNRQFTRTAYLESQFTNWWLCVWDAEEIEIMIIEWRSDLVSLHQTGVGRHGDHFTLDIATAVGEARAREGPHEWKNIGHFERSRCHL